MLSWIRLSHIADWCRAPLDPSKAAIPVPMISTDSRTLKPGEVFLALSGESFDGHDFVPAAVSHGAAAIIAERPFDVGIPVLVVESSLRALVQVGERIRDEFRGKVAAITGSAGKSSTKEMVAALLGEGTVASPASFNNLMGVSRTQFLVSDTTRFLVLEMGMNSEGEIAELCRRFRPQAGLITNIGDAHIGKLGGKEGIYRAKKELFDYLSSLEGTDPGVALNVGDPLVQKAYERAFRAAPRTVTYSAGGGDAEVCVLARRMDPRTGFLSLSLRAQGETFDARLPLFGLHHADNIAAAIALTRLLGLPLGEIRGRLGRIRPAPHRGEVISLAQGRVLIDESYNSNPTALLCALESLSFFDPTRRRVLVLGEMRELEGFADRLHEEVGERLAALHLRRPSPFFLLGVGRHMTGLLASVKRRIPDAETLFVESADEALAKVPSIWQARDVILVKGSRGVKLDRVAQGIRGRDKI